MDGGESGMFSLPIYALPFQSRDISVIIIIVFLMLIICYIVVILCVVV